MTELALTRRRGNRRRYELDGVGTLRLGGWASRWATAEAGERRWGFARRGIFKSVIEATDPAGTVVGAFEGRSLKRGGALRWDEREFVLKPDSMWRERYALVDGDRRLVTLDGKGWGKQPVRVDVDDTATIDPGLLLFAAFVVRALAEDASSAAAGGAAAVSAGS
ncbi:MAG: hypothetical protein QOI64_1554 [Solirubrobacteraceae bacterium]|jgi:hypothetical protein|nr:hypothetical protein [Solirubrobacteraceae bacterium]